MKSNFAKEQVLDVDFETARALHRVVRGMHDGECPQCHQLFNSKDMRRITGWECPECRFFISNDEAAAAIKAFGKVMRRNLAIFEEWRKTI